MVENMAHRCENCGALNPNDAKRCEKCNAPFDYITWLDEYGAYAAFRAGAVYSVIIAAVAFPVTIGAMIISSMGLGFHWMALAAGVSMADAFILYRFRDRLMRIGGIGPYAKKDWWR